MVHSFHAVPLLASVGHQASVMKVASSFEASRTPCEFWAGW